MAGGTHRRPVHLGSGFSSEAQGPADGKRRLIRGEGLVARISDDYRPQPPVVGKDSPGPATPCYVGTARLEETTKIRTRDQFGVPFAALIQIQSDNDVLYAEEENSAGDLNAPESEIETSDSESGVDFIEPDPTQQLLRPPVVAQTRPMDGGRHGGGGCQTSVRRFGYSSFSEDTALRPTTRLFSRDLQITVTQTPSLRGPGVSTRPGFILRMEVLRLKLTLADMLQISVMATEIAGGSPPADIDIYVVADMLQTEISVTTTEMAGGIPPVDIDICKIPDVLPCP